jgi:hypothetical protein
MSGLNWTKVKGENSISKSGAITKADDRERRETDRAAKWLAKVEASRAKKGRK